MAKLPSNGTKPKPESPSEDSAEISQVNSQSKLKAKIWKNNQTHPLNIGFCIFAGFLGLIIGSEISYFVYSSGSNTTPIVKSDFIFSTVLEKGMLEAVNKERISRNIQPLQEDASLTFIARIRSNDMAKSDYFSHSPPGGCDFSCLLEYARIKYTWAGENIAWNNFEESSSSSEAMKLFMESRGHRDNLLNCHYNRIGIGVMKRSDGRIFYTQIFEGNILC